MKLVIIMEMRMNDDEQRVAQENLE